MPQTPTVSVVMSVHNGARFLNEAVDSILQQTFTDFEFLIVDDGSVDSSPELLERYAALDKRIVLVRRERKGLTKSLNEGLALARGTFIARHDADDVALPHRLETMVRFMQANPSIAAAGSWCETINGEGRLLGRIEHPTDHDLIAWAMVGYNAIIHPTAVIRRRCVGLYGPYDEDYAYAQDYEFWTRWIRLGGKIANVPEILLKYRKSDDQITKKFSKHQSTNAIRGATAYITSIFPDQLKPEEVLGLRQLVNPFGVSADAVSAAPILPRLLALPRFAKVRKCSTIRRHLARKCVIAARKYRGSDQVRALASLLTAVRICKGILLERIWWICLAKRIALYR